MTIKEIPFDKTPQFTDRDVAYQLHPELFSNFLAYQPTLEGLLQAVEDRKSFQIDRNLLYAQLISDYEKVKPTELQFQHIESLKEQNTFTVVTAHQPSLLTGPLYYVTKLFSTVKLAQELSNSAVGIRIVPIFINGSEDHDFEEVDHLQIFGKSLKWINEERGAIGRKSIIGLNEVITEFVKILGDGSSSKEVEKILTNSLVGAKTYNDFTFKMINGLFGHTGIVVLSMDNKAFKQSFIPIIKKEILERPSEAIILKTQGNIQKELGYKAQAFPREINFFYLSSHSRERIEYAKEKYTILNTETSFTRSEMIQEIETYPERFSPNVVIRPLYQEFILPNIAYVGGGGELAYWLERKEQFKTFEIFYPALIRRNSTMVISKSQIKLLDKIGITIEEIFHEENEIIRSYLESQAGESLNIDKEKEQLENLISTLAKKAQEVDPTLIGFVEAEGKKLKKALEQIEGRLIRSYKSQEEVSVTQIKNIKGKLFPNKGIQERTDNYFQFYQSMGKAIEEAMLANLNPLNKNMLCFIDK